MSCALFTTDSIPFAWIVFIGVIIELQKLNLCHFRCVNADPRLRERLMESLDVCEENAVVLFSMTSLFLRLFVP